MTIQDVAALLEQLAPLSYQEPYDNSGLQVGSPSANLKGILISLDITPDVVAEASLKGCNLIVSHHPLIFSGLKHITEKSITEKSIALAIKKDIAIYSAHTNIDNIKGGVNSKIADLLGLKSQKILVPAQDSLVKLVTFVPTNDADSVRMALFDAGAGHIGNYDQCSYNIDGKGSFRGDESTKPYVGEKGLLHFEPEVRIEVIVPKVNISKVVKALISAHPYEEVAYDVYPLLNTFQNAGTGIIGELEIAADEKDLLKSLKKIFNSKCIRHTTFLNKKVKKVAVCGGSGASMLSRAIDAGADIFISADFKYHQFFEAESRILIADIGHFESEQFTVDIFYDYLIKNLPKFAVFKSEINTNPINYL